MNTARNPVLLANTSVALATIFFGVMTGFFWTYSFNVNYAMLQVDGSTYALMQSLFNQNVRHLMFFVFFFGAGVLAIIAVFFNLKLRRSLSFWLLIGAAVIYILGVIVYTQQVNLPLNYYTESWDVENLPNDWEVTRANWNSANLFRVLTSGVSFILYVMVLLVRTSHAVK